MKSVARREPANAKPRVQLANLYFDAERYDDAIKWYSEAVKLAPNDVDVSTDLGVCYYYTNQPDKALEQFDRSLKLDARHTKTLLNVGIVKAFGKQDLEGAMRAWQQVLEIAPDLLKDRRPSGRSTCARHPAGTPPSLASDDNPRRLLPRHRLIARAFAAGRWAHRGHLDPGRARSNAVSRWFATRCAAYSSFPTVP